MLSSASSRDAQSIAGSEYLPEDLFAWRDVAPALAHLGSSCIDLHTGGAAWSDEMYRILGVDPTSFEPTLSTFLMAVMDADRPLVERAFDLAATQGVPFDLEHHIVRPDGSIRVLHTVGRGKLGGDGQSTHLFYASQDITDRKRLEAEHDLLAEIVDTSQDAIMRFDLNGEIVTWNAAAERQFGFKAEEVVGKRVQDLGAPEDLEWMFDIIRRLQAGEHAYRYEVVHTRRDGTTFYGAVTISAIYDEQGALRGFSKVVRDVSEQKRSRDLLEASVTEKDALLREIHHRVKNNLQVISSLLNLELVSCTSDEARHVLGDSQRRIHSMALVHELLYRSAELVHVELRAYLRALVEYLASSYEETGRRVTTEIDVPQLSLDLDRLIPCGLVVNELVTNALRHAFPGGRQGHISVAVTQLPQDQVVLEVRDDGVGMPGTLDPKTTPTIGLRIVDALTQQLDGTIAVVAASPGTIARLIFPIR